ncbi:TetR/AcrR family transcriptional regulator [Altericroceibacterium endophyticum]|uniref:TetR family transcriptional regulator n=1 Tax=Altericroceibacterium endophyticum TaxID=1808508 RepID=A0A6I4T198_9SPHN|nr:TetR family transcriptional regulator [Altericroceibacterium endophyticum]MXO64706.1 TetR family transcriptional regulator [Altericroceibacterium endophyticum]
MARNSRQKLLEAAENLLIDRGVNSLTVRRIGERAELNAALITYHFGGIAELLRELSELNTAPMRHAWAKLAEPLPGDDRDLEILLRRWLDPLTYPAAFTQDGLALSVIDEIASHGAQEIRQELNDEMRSVAQRVAAAAAPLLPKLETRELMLRLRFIAGAALGPPPRERASMNMLSTASEKPVDALTRFAMAALTG